LGAVPVLAGLAAIGVTLTAGPLLRRSSHHRSTSWTADVIAGVDGALQSLRRPHWRLLGAVGYLAFDIAALGATFAAAGNALPIDGLVLGYVIGYMSNLIPVPGGFGALEAGLAGTLIAYGAPPTQAAAAVVVYHAIAFWIPSAGGLVGYARLRRRLVANEALPSPPLTAASERRPLAETLQARRAA
jgi:uncharacterized membrane protein YbhN (UPF0104 family)